MWYFYSPTLVFGEGALDHLETVEGEKCFIVTDPGIKAHGLLSVLTEKLESCGKTWQAFTDVEPDPSEETIYKAADQCKAFNPDLIIGLGGGSSLDTAKGVWVLYEHPEFTTVDEIHPFQRLHTGRKARLIAIPTTSGTGAEATWAVIVTRKKEGTHLKLEQGNKDVIPTVAIMDPIFPAKMPPPLTAATGFDALAHSMEGFVSTWQNPFSDAYAIHAVRLIFEYLPRAVKNGDDTEAREHLHNAATMAGLSFGNSQVIAGHSMGHALGALFHVPHGNAVGVCLPYVMEFCINDPESGMAQKKFGMMAKAVGVAEWKEDDTRAARSLVGKVRQLQEETGLPDSLGKVGISLEDLHKRMGDLIELCKESPSTVMTPRNVSDDEYRRLFEYVQRGDPIDF